MNKAFCLIRASQKAVAGLVGATAMDFITRHGLKASPDTEVVIVGLVTSLIVWLVPNQGCDE